MAWGFHISYIIIALRPAKLWPVKVGGRRKILAWAFSNPVLLSKSLDPRFLFNLQLWQVAWAMMTKSSSFKSPMPYLLTLFLKYSIPALLTSVRMCWKVPIYYINWVLVILNQTALYQWIKRVIRVSVEALTIIS